MPTLTKGANTAIIVESIKATLSWDTGSDDDNIDISALLLTDVGRVRCDDDFVFYNQPKHLSGAVAHVGRVVAARVAETLEVQICQIEPQITRIAFVASIHRGNFSAVRNIRLDLVAPGVETVTFPIEGCTTEAALVAGELYLRDGRWKFRAVGQGYDSGLAGIAINFGITVVDDASNMIQQLPDQGTSRAAVPPSTVNAIVPSPDPRDAPHRDVPAPTSESSVAPWYKVKHDLSVDFATSLAVGDIARTFKQVIRSKSRKAEFKAIEQLTDPFDQFNDNAEFAAAAIAKEFTKMWAIQIYIYDLGNERGVTLRVIGESGFARAFDGFQNSYSKTSGRKKADDVISALRQSDRQLSWAIE